MSLQPGPDNTLTEIPYVPPVQISQDANIDSLNVSKDGNIVGNLTVNGYLSALGGSNISGGGGGSSLTIRDEGTTITPSASSLNFVGTNVVATNSGNAVTITITTGSLILPVGTVSGSSQVSYAELSNIPVGIISSSNQLPSGIVSSSAQVSYTGLSNIPVGIISGSTVLRASNNLSDVANPSASLANIGGASVAFAIAMSVAL